MNQRDTAMSWQDENETSGSRKKFWLQEKRADRTLQLTGKAFDLKLSNKQTLFWKEVNLKTLLILPKFEMWKWSGRVDSGHVLMERLRVCQGILDLGNTGRIWRNYPKITFCKTLEGTKEIISNNIPVWYEILDYCNLILWYCCSANGPAADCFTRVCSGHMKVRRMRLANDEEVGMERKVLGARCSWWPWWPWWLILPTAKKLGWEGRY